MPDLLPAYLTPLQKFLINSVILYIVVTLRYIAFAGGFYLVCWKWKRDALQSRKILPTFPSKKILWTEFRWSLATSVVFAVTGAWMLHAGNSGSLNFYYELDQYGWFYLFLSLPIMMFIHDTYFYFTHRIIHWQPLYKRIHHVHHLSTNPSPWAAFSFHPYESLIEAFALPLVLLVMPVHPLMFAVFLMSMTFFGVINHLGYELYPAGFAKNPIGKWMITATHHTQHHELFRYNYGLYFTFWDRVLGTHHKGYEALYAKVVQRTKAQDHPTGAQKNLQL